MSLSYFPLFAAFDPKVSMVIYQELLPFAFLFSVVGLALSVYLSRNDPIGIVQALLIAVVTVSLLAGFPTGVQKLQKSFQKKGAHIRNEIDSFMNAWNQEIPEQTGGGIAKSIQNALCYCIYKLLQWVGVFGQKILEWFQPFALSCMIAMAPITICMYQIPPLRTVSFNTLLTTFGILLWPIGTAFADLFVSKVGIEVFSGLGISGVGAATIGIISWPALLGGFLLMALFMNLLYLCVPLGITAILRGASPALASAGAAAFMTASAMPLARSMSQLASAIGKMSGATGGHAPSSAGGESSESPSSSPLTPYRGGLSPSSGSSGEGTPGPRGSGPRSGGSGSATTAASSQAPLEGPTIDVESEVIGKAVSAAETRNQLLGASLALDARHDVALEN